MKQYISLRTMSPCSVCLAMGLLCCASVCEVAGQNVPGLISYQGVLTDASGERITGRVAVEFAIYDGASARTPLWSETNSMVVVSNGLFSVLLGSVTPLESELFGESARWLGIRVGHDSEMTPRTRIVSVAYAQHAAVADSATNAATALYAISSGYASNAPPDGDWSYSGNDIYRLFGNVGIGTATPTARLHVFDTLDYQVKLESGAGRVDLVLDTDTGNPSVTFQNDGLFRGSVGYNQTQQYLFLYEDGNVVVQNGRLGIGTVAPTSALDVVGTLTLNQRIQAGDSGGLELADANGDVQAFVRTSAGLGVNSRIRAANGNGLALATDSYALGIQIADSGNVGVGTGTPGEHQLMVVGGTGGTSGSTAHIENTRTNGIALFAKNASSDVTAILDQHGDGNFLYCDAWDGSSNWRRVIRLMNDGTVECKVLTITGGSDLTEGFPIGAASQELRPGMVVAIDPEQPGSLRLADKAYDHCVAGVISGAGDVKPGLRMGQPGTLADGQWPVALTGRAYCWADAAMSPIRPGDLLTSSTRPGHAMKATDSTRANGAVIGKAMTALDTDTGLILVLIALQ